jgi:hypothetical protein
MAVQASTANSANTVVVFVEAVTKACTSSSYGFAEPGIDLRTIIPLLEQAEDLKKFGFHNKDSKQYSSDFVGALGILDRIKQMYKIKLLRPIS